MIAGHWLASWRPAAWSYLQGTKLSDRCIGKEWNYDAYIVIVVLVLSKFWKFLLCMFWLFWRQTNEELCIYARRLPWNCNIMRVLQQASPLYQTFVIVNNNNNILIAKKWKKRMERRYQGHNFNWIWRLNTLNKIKCLFLFTFYILYEMEYLGPSFLRAKGA